MPEILLLNSTELNSTELLCTHSYSRRDMTFVVGCSNGSCLPTRRYIASTVGGDTSNWQLLTPDRNLGLSLTSSYQRRPSRGRWNPSSIKNRGAIVSFLRTLHAFLAVFWALLCPECAPDPAGGVYSAPPDPLTGRRGLLFHSQEPDPGRQSSALIFGSSRMRDPRE